MQEVIGIDLGGTNIRAALVDKYGISSKILWIKTPVSEGPEITVQKMAALILELKSLAKAQIGGVGIGMPGPLSRKERKIFQTPNLPGFENFLLGERLEALSRLSVYLDNDAKCASLGEGYFGNAQGMRDYILLTFGTGIGGAVVANGSMLYGKSDGACELGHMTLYPEGLLCKCGNKGCLEQYCSASAVARRAALASGKECSPQELFEAWGKNLLWAQKTLKEIAQDLSYACATLVNIFDPEGIIFSGGLFTEGGGPLCAWVQEGIQNRCFKSSQKNLKILPSNLKGEAGILGAASLVWNQSI